MWCFILLLAVVVVPACNHYAAESTQLEERFGRFSIQPIARAKAVIQSDEFKSGIPDLLANSGGITKLAKIDYKKPPKEVVKEMGDALLPILTTGLALIPGGAVISGVVSGLWGLFSPFLGEVKSPAEKMIDEIKEDIKKVRNEIKEMGKQVSKETDQKLGELVRKALHGKNVRNEYICNKYAMVSQDLVADMRRNGTIGETLRVEIISYMNDCDNFLKDSATSFVHDEYADVLWAPSVMTTLLRTGFLAEISNFGFTLRLDQKMIRMFWEELKEDIKKHFRFTRTAVKKRTETFFGLERQGNALQFSAIEEEACQMQAQLFYTDRQMYPHGVPKYFHIHKQNTELKIADFASSNATYPTHIQVNFNELNVDYSIAPKTLWNCLMGSDRIVRVPSRKMSLSVTYLPNKLYEIRILYFAIETEMFPNIHHNVTLSKKAPHFRKITKSTVHEDNENIEITIGGGKEGESSIRRFEIQTGYHFMDCIDYAHPAYHMVQLARGRTPFYNWHTCHALPRSASGYYVLEHVANINVDGSTDLKGNIIIKTWDQFLDNVAILGAEIIVLPQNSI